MSDEKNMNYSVSCSDSDEDCSDVETYLISHLNIEVLRSLGKNVDNPNLEQISDGEVNEIYNPENKKTDKSSINVEQQIDELIENLSPNGLVSFTIGTLANDRKIEEAELETERLEPQPATKNGSCCKKSSSRITAQPKDMPFECPDENGFILNTSNSLLPDPMECDKDKICLVLDMDETLIHSSFNPPDKPDFQFDIGPEGAEATIYVGIRPGLDRFLADLSPLFELVVFTASTQPYADAVLNFVDPKHYIKYRLYRDSCTDFGGHWVKDLSRLNRKLERLIIIDNSPTAYLFQPSNAIPISSWFDEKNDHELSILRDFLMQSYRVRNIYDIFGKE